MILVAGPTATGKSALAADLAESLDGTVINADSMQVYEALRVLTARPGPDLLERAPHRLYGVLSGDQPCSAGRWRDMALAEIGAAEAAGRVPIVVGGTGLYLEALSAGIADMPPIPAAIRAAVRTRLEGEGPAGLHAALAARDPAMAARLEPGDSQRVMRAWEVLEATGRSLAEWQAAMATPPAHLRFHRVLVLPPRRDVYAAGDRRFPAMVEAGAAAEVRALRDRGYDPGLPVMKAIGVPELGAWLDGQLSRDAAIARAQTATRHYAKRQMTWFRNRLLRPDATSPEPIVLEAQYCKSFLSEILRKLRIRR